MSDVIETNLATGETVLRAFTPEELEARDAHLAALEASRPERERITHNTAIQNQIAELDAKRVRPAAEVSLALALQMAPAQQDLDKLSDLTAQISILRSQLL